MQEATARARKSLTNNGHPQATAPCHPGCVGLLSAVLAVGELSDDSAMVSRLETRAVDRPVQPHLHGWCREGAVVLGVQGKRLKFVESFNAVGNPKFELLCRWEPKIRALENVGMELMKCWMQTFNLGIMGFKAMILNQSASTSYIGGPMLGPPFKPLFALLLTRRWWGRQTGCRHAKKYINT